MTFRTYRQVSGSDVSGLASQVEAQRARIRKRLRAVRGIVAVMSGKGGVGKSSITASLALAVQERQVNGVGVLDADLKSPTVARMLEASGPLRVTEEGVHPARGTGGVRVVSTDLLLEEGQPLGWREPGQDQFIWRGTLEAGALREFLSDVVWKGIDILLIDLPPGADGVSDLHALVPQLSGAIIVTIPTDESRRSVSRTMRAAVDATIPLLGVIENMSGTVCSGCGAPVAVFPGNAGERLAREFGVALLGRVPFQSAGRPSDDPPVDVPPQLVDCIMELVK